tara:strand:- start:7 stop:525 length:519 start_codon:yes stop_codon:yes gene_type:complete
MMGKSGTEVMRCLRKLKKNKKVKKIGFSVYDEKECRFLIRKYSPDIIQAPINIIDNRFKKIIEKNKNITFQARSIFLQGQLIDKKPIILKKHFVLKKYFDDLDDKCKDMNLTKIQACINFIKIQRNLDNVIFSIKNIDEFNRIIKLFNSKNTQTIKISPVKKNLRLLDPRKW